MDKQPSTVKAQARPGMTPCQCVFVTSEEEMRFPMETKALAEAIARTFVENRSDAVKPLFLPFSALHNHLKGIPDGFTVAESACPVHRAELSGMQFFVRLARAPKQGEINEAERKEIGKHFREASHLFPWNENTARCLRREWGVAEDKITVVRPGVDTTVFRPRVARKAADGVVRLLYIGDDFGPGGSGTLLMQWAEQCRYARRSTDVPFAVHLVTEIPLPGDDIPPGVFVHRAAAGNAAKRAALYQQCDILAQPTRSDDCSGAAMEAMASGLPVVISDIGGNHEIVADSITGYLVEPDNSDDLFSALEKLVLDERLRMMLGAAGRIRACAWFDRDTAVETILSIMQETTDRREPTLPTHRKRFSPVEPHPFFSIQALFNQDRQWRQM